MRYMAFVITAVVLCVTPASAEDVPPTVSLTAAELQTVINSEIARAKWTEAAQIAQPVLKKIQEAFSPKRKEEEKP